MEFDELYATHGNSACKAAENAPVATTGFRIKHGISRSYFHWTGVAGPNGIHISSFRGCISSLAEPFSNAGFYLLVFYLSK
jgi:hypothetical protein